MTTATPVIDADHAAFIVRGVSISVASCGADSQPSLVRALGCRVSDDRRSLTVMVSASQAGVLLDHVRQTGALAAVFSEPPTHRTIQLKAGNAIIGAPTQADLDCVARYRDSFVDTLQQMGYPPALIQTFLACPDDDIAALTFTPNAAFSQTPGPNAGQALLVHA